MTTFSLDDARAVCKKRDAWWTVFLVDPLAVRLTLLVANRTSITPDALTVGAFVLGLGAAGCFAVATPQALVAGAVLYHLSFVLDCVDGKIARLKGSGTFFGAWLDYMLDRLRVLACGVGLVTGLFTATGHARYLFLGFVILFMDMFRYVNALHVSKTRLAMGMALAEREGGPEAQRAVIAKVLGGKATDAEDDGVDEDDGDHGDDGDDGDAGGVGGHGEHLRAPALQPSVVEEPPFAAPPHRRPGRMLRAESSRVGFRVRFPLYGALCVFLRRHRVRVHLFSGVEFQMFVFIIGPLLAAAAGAWVTIPVTVGSGLLLGLFELMVIYRLWTAATDTQRALRRPAETTTAPAAAPVPRPRPMSSVGER